MLGMRPLGQTAQALLDRATQLARQFGHPELLPDHLLWCASHEALRHKLVRRKFEAFRKRVDLGSSNPPVEGDVAWSEEVRACLEAAQQAVDLDPLEEVHLLSFLDLGSVLGKYSQRTFLELFQSPHGKRVLATLQTRGVDTQVLFASLSLLRLADVLPAKSFYRSPPGQRVMDLHMACLSQPEADALSGLLAILVAGGQAAEALVLAGLSESVLFETLSSFAGPSVGAQRLLEAHLARAGELTTTECLGSQGKRLTLAAQVALLRAWDSSARQEVCTQLLLEGLLYADYLIDPRGGALGMLHGMGLLESLQVPGESSVVLYEGIPWGPLRFSHQTRQSLGHAFTVAGDSQASTAHILYGLCCLGQGETWQMLHSLGLTPQRIHNFLPG